jgi:hypothetical protein
MSNDILTVPQAKATFTITLSSLASTTARQSTMINNSGNFPGAIVYLALESGGSLPTNGSVYEVFLLRGDDPAASTYRTDGAGASDAAITIRNASRLGSIAVTNSANTVFYGEFDTAFAGVLGPEWGIAIRNSTGVAMHGTEGNHYKGYVYYRYQVQ